jgi:putative addiction module CopG family antidote
MPETMIHYMRNKVKSGGYGSVSEYIRELVRLDQRIEFARADAAQRGQNERPRMSEPDDIFEYEE